MGRCAYCWADGSGTAVTLIRCKTKTETIVELEEGTSHVCDEHMERVLEILENGDGMILAEDPGEDETIH